MKGFFFRLVGLWAVLSLFAVPARAAEAEDIMGPDLITGRSGLSSLYFLYDKDETWGNTIAPGGSLTLAREEGIGSLYFVFSRDCGGYTVTDDTGASYTRETPFLHDFLDLEQAFGRIPTSVTITFPAKTAINELYAFTSGQVPDFVQQWKLPREGSTDLVLFSTHGDDEHLFFAGLLPYYAGELGYQVQVVYMTDHHNNAGPTRMREMLDGLWAVGVETYPVFGDCPDYNAWDLDALYRLFRRQGFSREDLLGFVVEQLRRFRPKVAVGHDFAGEYGHTQHKAYAELLAEAVEVSMDPGAYPGSAEAYGVWDVPKTYIHLYGENPIVLNWDVPLEAFGGETAFEVSIWRGFQKHVSQVKDYEWYYRDCDTAAQIPEYSPCHFGLYRSTVGEDSAKDDLFENVTPHAEDILSQPEETTPPTETLPPLPETVPAAENPTEAPTIPTTLPTEDKPSDMTRPASLILPVFTVLLALFLLGKVLKKIFSKN